MNRSFVLAAVTAVAIFAVCVSAANAGIMTSMMSYDGTVDILTDTSAGIVVDADTSGSVSVNDLIQGVIEIDKVNTTNVTAGTIFGVYSFRVDTVDTTTGVVTLVADDVTALLSAAGISTAGLDDRSGLFGQTLSDSGIAVVSKLGAFDDTTDFSVTPTSLISGSTIGTVIDSSWDLELLAGFDGVDDEHRIVLDDPLYLNFADIATLDFGDVFARFRGAYSVFGFQGTGVQFLPIGVNTDFNSSTADVIGEFGIRNGQLTRANELHAAAGFLFGDDGDYRVNVTPEPASMLAWSGLGGLALLLTRYRRRRQAAK